MALYRLAGLAFHAVQLHEAHDAVLLRRYANQQQPVLLRVGTVVDDLATIQATVAVEHLHRLGLS